MKLTQEMLDYAVSCQEELKDLIRTLCVIPAPSGKEQKRADFCKAWFEKNGFENVTVDEALNVLAPYGVTEDKEIVVITAHTDVVFPDEMPLPFREDAEKFYAPSVCDDTANLAVMMIAARYFVKNKLPCRYGMLFAANTCEEGLGNLKGIRQIVKTYGSRMAEHISVDGTTVDETLTGVVGSARYRVTVRAQGGHSFIDFGNTNAIVELSRLIVDLDGIAVPKKEGTTTTRNVGTISGGTSVNTIAQEASMLCEYRSNDRGCMQVMQEAFDAAFRRAGHHAEVKVELVGERPCAGDVDEAHLADLIARADESARFAAGKEPVHIIGSTDCNIPLAEGIPAVCIGVAEGHEIHTRGEYLVLSSLLPGCNRMMHLLSGYFG